MPQLDWMTNSVSRIHHARIKLLDKLPLYPQHAESIIQRLKDMERTVYILRSAQRNRRAKRVKSMLQQTYRLLRARLGIRKQNDTQECVWWKYLTGIADLYMHASDTLAVYDHGDDYIDRYSVVLDGAVIDMSATPLSPQGVDMYVGNASEYPISDWTDMQVAVDTLPDEVQEAIRRRVMQVIYSTLSDEAQDAIRQQGIID